MKLSALDYPFDRSLIAQEPLPRRGRSRLLSLDRTTGEIAHGTFPDLLAELTPTDLLVLNQTKVWPARVVGKKSTTGGAAELLFLHPVATPHAAQVEHRWHVLAKGRLRCGQRVEFPDGHHIEVMADEGNGYWQVQLNGHGDMTRWFGRVGQVPLPPYIKRPIGRLAQDRRSYQTIYARVPGSVAAPTAGLHFSAGQLRRLRAEGIPIAMLTLHIGVGTFQPIRCDDVEQHRMASEYLEVDAVLCRSIDKTRQRDGRVIAVGTSTVRALETAARDGGRLRPFLGWTDLFILPGYRFRIVDALLTNFHLPKSSVLCLASAFAGRERLLAAYGEAVRRGYRFYSYGDAMFIRTKDGDRRGRPSSMKGR